MGKSPDQPVYTTNHRGIQVPMKVELIGDEYLFEKKIDIPISARDGTFALWIG